MQVKMCPDELREVLMEWLIPATEDGEVDHMYRMFCEELTPYALAIAQRIVRERMHLVDLDAGSRLRIDLVKVLRTIEGVSLNPDMMAAAFGSERELAEAELAIRNWLRFLEDHGREAIVHPGADVVMRTGGSP